MKQDEPNEIKNAEPPSTSLVPAAVSKTTPSQFFLMVLGVIAFLYFARPVVLPIFLACVAAMTLKPLIRWSAELPADANAGAERWNVAWLDTTGLPAERTNQNAGLVKRWMDAVGKFPD